jgi:hypothetical protein
MPISFVDIQHPAFQNNNINILSPLSIIISTEDITSMLQFKVTDKAAIFKLYDKLFYCTERVASNIYFATLNANLHDHSALTPERLQSLLTSLMLFPVTLCQSPNQVLPPMART